MKKSLSKPQSIATKSAFKPLIKVTSTIQSTVLCKIAEKLWIFLLNIGFKTLITEKCGIIKNKY